MLFGVLVSRWPVSRKGLVVERNGVKFRTHGQYMCRYKYRGYIWTCSVQYHLGVIRRILSQNGLYLENASTMACLRVKRCEIWESGTLDIHI